MSEVVVEVWLTGRRPVSFGERGFPQAGWGPDKLAGVNFSVHMDVGNDDWMTRGSAFQAGFGRADSFDAPIPGVNHRREVISHMTRKSTTIRMKWILSKKVLAYSCAVKYDVW